MIIEIDGCRNYNYNYFINDKIIIYFDIELYIMSHEIVIYLTYRIFIKSNLNLNLF